MRAIVLLLVIVSSACNRDQSNDAYRQTLSLAEAGYPAAQFQLGAMFDRGEGVEKNLSEAKAWYSKAAEQGLPEAQFNLGYMYLTGKGMPEDRAKAFQLYYKAAQQGLADAQYNIGLMFHNNDDVASHIANVDLQAIRFTRMAAEQGHLAAQYNLGVWYGTGDGAEMDDAEAFKWYLKAAQQGDENSQIVVGGRYILAQGTEKDAVLGYAWLLAGESDEALRYQQYFKPQLTPEELEAAQILTEKCRHFHFRGCQKPSGTGE